MDLRCYLQHTGSPMNQHCLHPSLIPHLSRLLSSHSSLKCYAPARKARLWFYHIYFIVSGFSNFSGCTLYLNYLLFFYLANSSLSFKNQLICHSSRKPFLPPSQHLFAKARLNVPLLWFHKALCIASSVIWLYFFFFFASPPSGILVPLPGTRPAPPELKAWSLNYWTAREVSGYISLYLFKGLSPHSAHLNSTRTGEHLIHLFFPWAFIHLFNPCCCCC